MQISIEGVNYTIPVTLSEITIHDRILYDKSYGADLRKEVERIASMPDGFDKEMEALIYHGDLACKTLSHFGKIPMDIIQNTKMEDVFIIYHNAMSFLSQEVNFLSDDWQLKNEFDWDGGAWSIQPPELKHTSKIDFGEFLDSKQIVKNLFELGDERWEALLQLCCVFFRRKDEKYTKELAYENGERYNRLKNLPLEYALNVGFFLKGSMTFYLETSQYSGHPAKVLDQN